MTTVLERSASTKTNTDFDMICAEAKAAFGDAWCLGRQYELPAQRHAFFDAAAFCSRRAINGASIDVRRHLDDRLPLLLEALRGRLAMLERLPPTWHQPDHPLSGRLADLVGEREDLRKFLWRNRDAFSENAISAVCPAVTAGKIADAIDALIDEIAGAGSEEVKTLNHERKRVLAGELHGRDDWIMMETAQVPVVAVDDDGLDEALAAPGPSGTGVSVKADHAPHDRSLAQPLYDATCNLFMTVDKAREWLAGKVRLLLKKSAGEPEICAQNWGTVAIHEIIARKEALDRLVPYWRLPDHPLAAFVGDLMDEADELAAFLDEYHALRDVRAFETLVCEDALAEHAKEAVGEKNRVDFDRLDDLLRDAIDFDRLTENYRRAHCLVIKVPLYDRNWVLI